MNHKQFGIAKETTRQLNNPEYLIQELKEKLAVLTGKEAPEEIKTKAEFMLTMSTMHQVKKWSKKGKEQAELRKARKKNQQRGKIKESMRTARSFRQFFKLNQSESEREIAIQDQRYDKHRHFFKVFYVENGQHIQVTEGQKLSRDQARTLAEQMTKDENGYIKFYFVPSKFNKWQQQDHIKFNSL